MNDTTLGYIEHDGCYLMLHRVKKQGDANRDKWLGIGGHIEPGETPHACMIRECLEETGLTLHDATYRGVVHFRSNVWPDEDMHLFTASEFSGDMIECNEGTLEWVEMSHIPSLNLWQGDRIFLKLLADGAPFFHLTLVYDNETLASAELDGSPLPI